MRQLIMKLLDIQSFNFIYKLLCKKKKKKKKADDNCSMKFGAERVKPTFTKVPFNEQITTFKKQYVYRPPVCSDKFGFRLEL